LKSAAHQTWSLLRPYARKRVPELLLVLLMGAITSTAQNATMLLLAPLWGELFPEARGAETLTADAGTFARAMAWAREQVLGLGWFEDDRLTMLLAISLAALGLAVVGAAAQWAFLWTSRRATYRMLVDLRVDVARHLMGLSMRYHGQRRLGDLLSRVSSDVTGLTESINLGVKGLVLDPMMSLGSLGAALWLAPVPTLGVIVGLPLALLPISRLSRKVRRGSKKSLGNLGDSVQTLTQMFQGVRTVKAFGGEAREVERYRQVSDRYLGSVMRMVKAIALSQAWAVFFSIAGVMALVLVLGYAKIRFGVFADAGNMVAWFMLIARTSNFVKDGTRTWTRVEESIGASIRIQELLDEAPDVVEAAEARPVAAIGQRVRFEGVHFHYPEGDTAALRELDLEIVKGETLAIVGPSGAGKSTLIDLLARFIDPTQGRITVDGVDLRELRLADWTALYAMVGQVPFLFHATIGENIAYGKPDATREEIEAAARAAHIHDFISGLAQGYDTDAADMGSRLSGGQRQRITIARALLKGAPLLLLDEATSALDSESEAEVQRALDELMKDRTVVVVAHRLSTIQRADRIAVFEHGRLVELGAHEALIAKGGVYARLWKLQKLDIRSDVPAAT
jgi:ABC-type multidrug transport system fused ATPase/permease subunit